MRNKVQIVNDSVIVENFSETYPYINKYVLENGELESSRNGSTKEILDFKTKVSNPYKRCVGNNSRNINVFFLLAESMWIFAGKKDVETLSIFNEQMKEYSDDGNSFHAPYGFRMRHYGVSSFDPEIKPSSENSNHYSNQVNQGIDQLLENLIMLSEDSQSRRAVLSIWNPELDCNKKSKDLPCNDMLMLKVRNNKLISTISNRSNDLHWGLPTNIFQFSFFTELISLILGVELGTQTHNSQSLHIYTDNDIALNMYENMQFNPNFVDLYDISSPFKLDFNFISTSVQGRLAEIDTILNLILDSFTSNEGFRDELFVRINKKSNMFATIYSICHVYLSYKKQEKNDKNRVCAIEKLFISGIHTNSESGKPLDIHVLAQNFFLHRIKELDKFGQIEKILFTNEKL